MRSFFFDLDGTLADSRVGLLNAFKAGIAAAGGPDLPDETLQHFIGTPLPNVFEMVRPGLGKASIESGIEAFRQHYEAEGIFQNELYPGVAPMLERLYDARAEAWVVTSKPLHHATQVVTLLGLNRFVTGIVGAGLDETDTKTSLVAKALSLSGARPSDTIMLGDRHYDVIGALDNDVLPVGALWGYGTWAELRHAGCKDFAETPLDFARNYKAADRFRQAAG